MRTPLLLALLLLGLAARPQQHRPTRAEKRQLYLEDARAFPRLYDRKDFDSIAYYIQLRWQPGPIAPDLFSQAILLSIQRHIFYLVDFHDYSSLTWPMIEELDLYARDLADFRRRMLSGQAPGGYYSDTDQQLFLKIARWADDLRKTQELDSVENFMCLVFSGAVRYPEDYLALHSEGPPPYYGLLNPHRTGMPKVGAVMTLSAGIWVPGGHLSRLGVHPSINYGLGARSWNNEWDFDAELRFANAPRPYTILRNDTLMSRTYYDGGNASLNYTRYLLHHACWEAGPTAGLGADFIDFTNGNTQVDWSPTEIATFDVHVGFRYNWYFSRHGFVGVVARYHFLGYRNPGGSPFDGNAATIDIILGRAGNYKH